MFRIFLIGLTLAGSAVTANAQSVVQTKGDFVDKFRQLEEILPTPNVYRTASGAPGHQYWQQRADYVIRAELDEENKRITGSETITYRNNSPDRLRYLWLQLDQNHFREDSIWNRSEVSPVNNDRTPFFAARQRITADEFNSGFKIAAVRDEKGNDIPFTVSGTMMRLDLASPLAPGKSTRFSVDWSYNIVDGKTLSLRGGWEYFEEDGNDIFEIAQWFPRMASYTDVNGWQHKQFIYWGEFALDFGDYDVRMTVPADHIVASTGALQNPDDVLTPDQKARLDRARTADRPVIIVSEDEAIENEKARASDKKTWHFKAENVRDFAWASSRKFIWDAQGYQQPGDGRTIMAMSYYPKEGNPIWERFSTHAIIQTMETYSKFTFDYPYPVALSVNGPAGGMEYPMISFNGPRPVKDKKTGKKTYSRRTKYGLIGVIIHEVGHNYFPMIVSSDERQWMWMDEGFNSFLQFLAQQEWEEGYPARRGDPRDIIPFMVSKNQVPIMTNSDSLFQLGNNAYAKPTTAFNILRETVMGRELFDFAFKEYANRWKFKHPQPADFFRTMEDASGIDLDWFWRGWFYTTDHVDIAIDNVRLYTVNTKDPEVEEPWKRNQQNAEPQSLTDQRNMGMPRRTERFPELLDFYNENDDFTVTNKQRNEYNSLLKGLDGWEKALLEKTDRFYVIDFSNEGGLVMPIILGIEYADGSTEELRIPAEIWRRTPKQVSKMLVREKEIKAITLDPHWETADADVANNHFPRKPVQSRLELFKNKPGRDLMKEMETELKDDKD